ncbi:hypothetical protein D9611_011249 [Ephemerocybe angulata]|uniref:Uncharacterized protein n=1 Tax=Ephemerocybe angulata TaxID=980116 RepID=A0A8H5CC56_9AGAR|nr:hypothetical protein D9611_011249 [Tulosesus angulatus]
MDVARLLNIDHRPFSEMPTDAELVGAELYKKLVAYFISLVQRIQKGGIELLRDYGYEWDRYIRGAAALRSLFSHLDRHWIKRERDEGKRHLALVQWNMDSFCLGKWASYTWQLYYP